MHVEWICMYIVHNSTLCEINLFDLGVDAIENIFYIYLMYESWKILFFFAAFIC